MIEFKNYLEMTLKEILQEKAQCMQNIVKINSDINIIRSKVSESKTNYHKGTGEVLESNEYGFLMGEVTILETEKESLKFNLVVIEDAINYIKLNNDKHKKVIDLLIADGIIVQKQLDKYYVISKN